MILKCIEDIRSAKDTKEPLAMLRSLSVAAPAKLRQARPSIPWVGLSRIGLGKPADSVTALLSDAKSAILSEFGLDSGALVHCEKTASSFAAIIDSAIEGKGARLLFMDGVLSSAEYKDGSPALYYPPYLMRSFELLQSPREALVIGVAGGTIVEVLKRAFPRIHVDGVDIDSRVMELGKAHFSLKEDSRTTLHTRDGREFVEKSGKRYDMAVIDAFRGLRPVHRLSTVEFARSLRKAMVPGGVCAINVIAKVERAGYLQHCYGTWRSAFKNVFALPVCREGEVFNVILVATDKDTQDFEKRNSHLIYPMDFDPGQACFDPGDPIDALSPY